MEARGPAAPRGTAGPTPASLQGPAAARPVPARPGPCRVPPRACERWGGRGPRSAAADGQALLGEVLRGVHDDLVAVPDVAGEQRLRQLVADRRLDQPAQRPGAVDR